MNRVRKQKLLVVVAIVAGVAITIGLALFALRQNINLFYQPLQIVAGDAPIGQQMRVGGLVVEGSVKRDPDTLDVQFGITDGQAEITIYYNGILPDLFREGQGIVANGTLESLDSFRAEEVLAKHDSTYMPPEVDEALKKAAAMGQTLENPHQGSYEE